MPTECCVPGCLNRTGHAFPWSDKTRVKAWEIAVRRDKWKPTKHSVVCSDHFDVSDYLTTTTCGTRPLHKRLKKTAVPHIFPWSPVLSEASERRRERAERKADREMYFDIQRRQALHDVLQEEIVASEPKDHGPVDVAVQTDERAEKKTETASTQSDTIAIYSVERFAADPEGIHFYTGLGNYSKFRFVFTTLGRAVYDLNYFDGVAPPTSAENQFFITLIKLRQCPTNFELSRMFGLNEANISNIFITWINFMALQWDEAEWWPQRDLVRFYSPVDFKHKFPATRVIIDGTECPMMKPKQPLAQQATFSSYKNRNTVKVLAGISPGGLITYVSPAYGGSASDRQICERSSLMQLCDPGDSIMSDKGFNVQDLFETKMVTVNIPTFFKKKNRLSGNTVLAERKIASKRVHVERIIGLAKTYKILKKPLNNTESVLATQIIKVCFFLCNFRANIVSSSA